MLQNSHEQTSATTTEPALSYDEMYSIERGNAIGEAYDATLAGVEQKGDTLEQDIEYVDRQIQLSDKLGDQARSEHFRAIKQSTEDQLWGSDQEEALRVANEKLDEARTAYAEQIANRGANTVMNTGGELMAGTGKSAFTKFDSQKLKEKNGQFRYEVALGVVAMLNEDNIASENTEQQTPEEKEKQRKLVVIEQLLGKEGDPDANQTGELFKLNEAVRQMRILKSKLYEKDDDGNIAEKNGRFARARQKFYKRWNQLSERGGAKSWAEMAAYIGGGGIAAGAALGAGLGLGVAGAATAGLATRISKTLAVTQLEKRSNALRADAEAEDMAKFYEEERARAHQAVEDGDSHWVVDDAHGIRDVISAGFTEAANKQARRNRARMAIGILTVSGAVLVGSQLAPRIGIGSLTDRLGIGNPDGTHRGGGNNTVTSSTPTEPPTTNTGKPGTGTGPTTQPQKPTTNGNRPRAPRPVTIKVNEIGNNYVAEVYEQHLGLRRGFLEMIRAARVSIAEGDLIKVQSDPSDPNKFWYKVTQKGAKNIGRSAVGSSRTIDVMKVLAEYSPKTKLVY